MNKVTCGITMSLDAFVAGPNQSFAKPFGDIPDDLLHHWMFEEPEKHQAELHALMDAGAFIMGSNMYGPKERRESPDWKGWPQWGDNPPIMHRSSSCLISKENLLRWREAPPTSSWPTALKQPFLPPKKQPGREMLQSWAVPIRSINVYQLGFLMSYGSTSRLSPSVLEHVSLRMFPSCNLNLLK
jgi:hypothetical protein